MSTEIQGSFGPLCDGSDDWSLGLGLDDWVKQGRTDSSLVDDSDSEVSKCCLLVDDNLTG